MRELLVVLQGVIFFSVIAFGIWWLTKKVAHGLPGSSRSGYMEILDRLAVSQDKCLEIVRIGDKCYVIGVEPSGITLLKELELDQLEKIGKAGKTGPAGEEPPLSSFASILSRLKQKGDRHG